jgi:hypothetical protein
MKFFFEGESEKPKESADKEFFFMLQEAGIVQQPGDKPQDIAADAKMQTQEGKLASVEYGTYQETYSIHVTSTHPKRNLSEGNKVQDAMRELIIVMNEYVPQTLKVVIHPPRSDWPMKVISAVVEGGATAWNFDIPQFEKEGVPRIIEAVEKVIMR